MIIGYVLGFVFLPLSILLFSNALGFTSVSSLLGIPVLLIGAIGIIAVEIGDIIDSHIHGSPLLMYFTGTILAPPGLLYLLSLAVKLPARMTAAMPIMIASFLFVEGVSSFHIGE
ncbi:hypothetical protein JW826_05450 [Candidatus Woesearchaeota archaeon]|nr:hypothetical protein [Candidatus Woesearchaeota archaeon]